MLSYRAALPLSRQTLTFTAGVIRPHRAAIVSCWRKLSAGRQALLVLAYLRKGTASDSVTPSSEATVSQSSGAGHLTIGCASISL